MAEDGKQIDINIRLTSDTKGGKEAENTVNRVEKSAKEANEAVVDSAKKTGKAVVDAAKDTGNEVSKEAKKAEKVVGDAASKSESTGKSAASGLKSAYEGFGKTINTVGKAVGAFTKALGLIGFAISAIQTVVEVFRKLHEWLHEDEIAAAKLREEMEKQRYAENVERAAEAYAKLNEQIIKSNEAEREKDAILDARENKKRAVEDANLKLQEEQELAAVDDNDPDANAKRTLIRNKYAMTRAQNAARRASEDNDRQRNALYQSAEKDEDDARAVREQMQGQLGKNVDEARRKYNQAKYQSENATKKSIWTGARVADEDARAKAKEQLPELEKQLDEAMAKYAEAKKKAEELEESARKKTKQATELIGADKAAQINAAAEQVAISTSNRQTNNEMDKARQERERQAAEKERRDKEKRDKETAQKTEYDEAKKAMELLEQQKAELEAKRDAAQSRKDAANMAVYNAQGNAETADRSGNRRDRAAAGEALRAAEISAQNVNHEADKTINAVNTALNGIASKLKQFQHIVENFEKRTNASQAESVSGQ